MKKYCNNQLPLRAFSMHAVRTSTKDNERVKTVRKGIILAVLSIEKLEPWLANKSSEKDMSVENNGWRNSRFKI